MEAVPSHFEGLKLYPHQEQACRAILSNKNVLLVSPTGSGKSLCYLLPTKLTGRPTLVISPLIALMEDQIRNAQHFGFVADAIHSGTSKFRQWSILARWLTGDQQIIVTSPERLMDEKIRRHFTKLPPGLIVVDEAHCAVTWGQRFRPAYQKLGGLITSLGRPPVLAMTATATPTLRASLIESLGIGEVEGISVPFLLPHMNIRAMRVDSSAVRVKLLCSLLADNRYLPMVVYCPTRRMSEALTNYLCGRNVTARVYHAGQKFQERRNAVQKFRENPNSILIATPAFEMGIDIPGIRTAVHFGLPTSLLSYVQGIGRAGRDKNGGKAILLYCESDLDRMDSLLSRGGTGDAPRDQLLSDAQTLRDVFSFAASPGCRLLYLNRYFFPDIQDHGEPCGRCDNCAHLARLHAASLIAFPSRTVKSPKLPDQSLPVGN